MKTLVVYLMAGPDAPELAAAAVAGGADIVELGFPFSDPLADGIAVGTSAVEAAEDGPEALRRYTQTLRKALDLAKIPV